MRISIHYEENLRSLFLATTRTVLVAKVTNFPPYSAATPFHSWFQWPSRSVALFVRVIAKMPFAKVSFLPKRSLSFKLPQAIQRLSQMNIGIFFEHFMAFYAAHDIGMKRSIKFSFLMVWSLLSKIPVSSPALFKTPTTLTVMFLTSHSLLSSTLMTLFPFWRIQMSRNCSVAISASIVRWISWVLSSGFLVFTSRGAYLHPWSLFNWTSPVLPQTLWKVSFPRPVRQAHWLPHIALVSRWTWLLPQQTNLTPPLRLGWEIYLEFHGIPGLFQFWTFWSPEFSSEFYFFDCKMCSRQFWTHFFQFGILFCHRFFWFRESENVPAIWHNFVPTYIYSHLLLVFC